MVRIAEILPGSIADELELEVGSRVVRINGQLVRDTLDLRFLEVDGELEVEVSDAAGGETVVYEIEKTAGEGLGIVPAPDAVRQCANQCVFCFVDGNPTRARRSLHLKDDDFRLSFTYGSYVTLTNLGARGFERLIEQRLSPLYVSVHATEPAVRERLLGVARGGNIVEHLQRLTEVGIEVHTQVVLCPEWNDGDHLDRTIDELWSLGERVLSLSVVPVGLTQYNLNRPVRLLTEAEAGAALAQVERGRARALRERGTGWLYAGDELYFIAGQAVPAASYYDDWPLTENGVGSVRRLLDEFAAGIAQVGRLDGRRIGLLTGTRMAQVFAPLAPVVAARTGAELEVVGVENTMFGGTVNTAGLLPGEALLGAARGRGFDAVLLSAESLNDSGRFVDDMPLAELVRELSPAHVLPAHELTSALQEL